MIPIETLSSAKSMKWKGETHHSDA